MHVQATADTHTVARMWRFLRDGHFLDSHSHQLTLQLAMHNSAAHITTFWNLLLCPLSSGSIEAHGALSPIPSGLEWPPSRHDYGAVAIDILACAVAVLYTLFITGLLSHCNVRHRRQGTSRRSSGMWSSLHGSFIQTGTGSHIHMSTNPSYNTQFSASAAPTAALERSHSHATRKHTDRVSFSSMHGRGAARAVAESHAATEPTNSFNGNSASSLHVEGALAEPCKGGEASVEIVQTSDAQIKYNKDQSEVHVGLPGRSGCSVGSSPQSELMQSSSTGSGSSPLDCQDSNILDGVISASFASNGFRNEAVEKSSDHATTSPPHTPAVQRRLVGKRPRPQPEPLGESSEHTSYQQLQGNRFVLDSPRTTLALGNRSSMESTVAYRDLVDSDVGGVVLGSAPTPTAAADTSGREQLQYTGGVPLAAWHLESFRTSGASVLTQQLQIPERGPAAPSHHLLATEPQKDPTVVIVEECAEQMHATAWNQDTSRPLESAAMATNHAFEVERQKKRRTSFQSINSQVLSRQMHDKRQSHAAGMHEDGMHGEGDWDNNILEDVGDEYVLYQHHHVSGAPLLKGVRGGRGIHPRSTPWDPNGRVSYARIPSMHTLRQGIREDHWRPPGWLRGLTVVSVIGLAVASIAALILSTRAHQLVRAFDTSNLRMPDAKFLPAEVYNDLQSATRMLMPQKVPDSGISRSLLHTDENDLTSSGALLSTNPRSTPDSPNLFGTCIPAILPELLPKH